MRNIESEYRAATRLHDRGAYKIFYSHVHPFPLLALGQNPAGETNGADLTASDAFFENWEHDFVRFRHCLRQYPLAGPMCDLLEQSLDTKSEDVLRQVPVTNVIFRRAQNLGPVLKTLNLTEKDAVEEARPFVERILKIVNPHCILFFSNKAYKLFIRYYCRLNDLSINESNKVFTPNGRNEACIFFRSRGIVHALGREIEFVMVGHPSKYSTRPEWSDVTGRFRSTLQSLQPPISPIRNSSALIELSPLPGHDTRL
ncbi:MAG: hypothetical protein WBS22_06840 [Methylocystis sp.]